jgi:hypothetical protein
MTAAFPRWGAIAGLTHHFGKTIFGMTKPACGGKHANAACVGLSSDAPLCQDCAAMAGISIAAPMAENARILISRNRREGGYCGKGQGRHSRAGFDAFFGPTLTLREFGRIWSRA